MKGWQCHEKRSFSRNPNAFYLGFPITCKPNQTKPSVTKGDFYSLTFMSTIALHLIGQHKSFNDFQAKDPDVDNIYIYI